MSEFTESSAQWLEQELKFINETMAHTLNGRMEASLKSVDDAKQELVLRFPLKEWQVNGLGTLHGGMTYSMMDLAMSIAVYCFSRQTIPPTISMSVNYQRPIPMEGSILIRTQITSLGRKNATAYCEAIVPGTGKIACTAIGTYAVIPKA